MMKRILAGIDVSARTVVVGGATALGGWPGRFQREWKLLRRRRKTSANGEIARTDEMLQAQSQLARRTSLLGAVRRRFD